MNTTFLSLPSMRSKARRVTTTMTDKLTSAVPAWSQNTTLAQTYQEFLDWLPTPSIGSPLLLRESLIDAGYLKTLQEEVGAVVDVVSYIREGLGAEVSKRLTTAVLDAAQVIADGSILDPKLLGDPAAVGAKAKMYATQVAETFSGRLRRLNVTDLAEVLDVLLNATVPSPQALALSQAVSYRLSLLDCYHPSDILFYNSPPAQITPVPTDFDFPLGAHRNQHGLWSRHDFTHMHTLAGAAENGLFHGERGEKGTAERSIVGLKRKHSMVAASQVALANTKPKAPFLGWLRAKMPTAETNKAPSWPDVDVGALQEQFSSVVSTQRATEALDELSSILAVTANSLASAANSIIATQNLFTNVEQSIPQSNNITAEDSITNNINTGLQAGSNSIADEIREARRRRAARSTLHWHDSLCVLKRATKVSGINYALLTHGVLLMSMAPYNVHRARNGVLDAVLPRSRDNIGINAEQHRATYEGLMRKGLGLADDAPLQITALTSDRACAIAAHSPTLNLTVVAFRGTKDVVDVITDISFVPSIFPGTFAAGETPEEDSQRQENAVHAGFALAYESIASQVGAIVIPGPDDPFPTPASVLFVGHSLGGAMAQLAAVRHGNLKPNLITVAAPAVGNDAFCKHLELAAVPYGGYRIWNEADVVPLLAQLVGYRHAGVPVKRRVGREAVSLYESSNINANLPPGISIASIAPHMIYTVGPVVYAFPILGTELPQNVTV